MTKGERSVPESAGVSTNVFANSYVPPRRTILIGVERLGLMERISRAWWRAPAKVAFGPVGTPPFGSDCSPVHWSFPPGDT
jgi:hypothetical protein